MDYRGGERRRSVEFMAGLIMGGLSGKTIVLLITGSIAAYKSPDLIRRLKERGARVRPVLTHGGAQFVTSLALSSVAHERVFDDLFNKEDELDVGHVRLARDADMILVAPASADFLGKMALGLADDLATALLLAASCPIVVAPAMNPVMWAHPAVRRNCATLSKDGVTFLGPSRGEMAERGEEGLGRMLEPVEITEATEKHFAKKQSLRSIRALVTAGPTHEPIDPVRYIANRSSGKQGYAIAAALADLGAQVTLVSGPVNLSAPENVRVIGVETASEMERAVKDELPVDVAIMTAAVADWRVDHQGDEKIKKAPGEATPVLKLVENPDILAGIGGLATHRPRLVIGFAAETNNVVEYGKAKLSRKKADWIVANDVSPHTGVMGGDENKVFLIQSRGIEESDIEEWPNMSKRDVAQRLADKIADYLKDH